MISYILYVILYISYVIRNMYCRLVGQSDSRSAGRSPGGEAEQMEAAVKRSCARR